MTHEHDERIADLKQQWAAKMAQIKQLQREAAKLDHMRRVLMSERNKGRRAGRG